MSEAWSDERESTDAERNAASNAASHKALEDLLGAIWDAEENWRFDDRIDLAIRNEEERQRRIRGDKG